MTRSFTPNSWKWETAFFTTEDKPMIERQQIALGFATDLLAQEPAVLPVDKAGLREHDGLLKQ